jgi:flagellar protein FliO/FliZ
MHSLFGVDVPAPALFFLVFIIVLGPLIWFVRRFGSGRLGSDATRGRQQRLGVTEQAFLRDGRRQLILVRRDNVEHLMLIGGPTDVVVESNIVRAVAASRDVAVARPAPLEPLPRAIPLPDSGNGAWPLQPEPMTPPPAARPAPKIEPVADEPPAWPLQPQAETPPPPRPQRDTLAALADELSARPAPPPPSPPPARNRPPGPPRGLEPRIEPRGEPRPEPRGERIAPPPPTAPAAADTAAADQSLAEMAHRLEAALRKPNAPAEARTAAPPRQAPAADQAAAPEPAAPAPPPPMSRAARPQAEPKQPPRGNAPAKPPQPAQGGTLYDNLEQEMASLLGRPTNKN